MSLDRDDLKPCAGCGAPCDGDLCSPACASAADELRERHEQKLRERLHEAGKPWRDRQAARKRMFASLDGAK